MREEYGIEIWFDENDFFAYNTGWKFRIWVGGAYVDGEAPTREKAFRKSMSTVESFHGKTIDQIRTKPAP